MIQLRDGDQWFEISSLPSIKLSAFELLGEVKGGLTLKLGDAMVADVQANGWTPIRVRVAGNRSQVWLNNRVYSDVILEANFPSGKLSTETSTLRKIHIRKL